MLGRRARRGPKAGPPGPPGNVTDSDGDGVGDGLDAFPTNPDLSWRTVAGDINVTGNTNAEMVCHVINDPNGICTVPLGAKYGEISWETSLDNPAFQAESIVWVQGTICSNYDFVRSYGTVNWRAREYYWFGPVTFNDGGGALGIVGYWDCHRSLRLYGTGWFTGGLDYFHIRIEVFG